MTHLPDTRRKRLLFRSWHRGTREADLILGSFADEHLAGFDEVQLDRYEALLDGRTRRFSIGLWAAARRRRKATTM